MQPNHEPPPRQQDPVEVVAAYQGVDGSYSSVVLRAYFTARGVALRGLGVRTFRDVAANESVLLAIPVRVSLSDSCFQE